MSRQDSPTRAPDTTPITTVPADGRSPFKPVRLAFALGLGPALWIGPFMAFNAVLLPARLEQVAPDDKVSLVALLAVTGSLVAMAANIIFGALSDLTRTRFGRRAPWLIIGSLGASASLFVLLSSNTVFGIVASWMVFQAFLNAIAAPLLAMLADRVPSSRRGTYSAVYGVGSLIGVFASQIVASQFVLEPAVGMAIFAVVVLLAGPVIVLVAPEKSNLDVPRESFSRDMIVKNFSFPRRGARDYYFAFSAKTLFMLGTYSLSGYQLFLMTDYIGIALADVGDIIAMLSLISLVTTLVVGAVAGPISDKLGRRKIFVMGSALLVAVGALLPFIFPELWAFVVYSILGGIGGAIFTSVDQALNTEVLPDPSNAAKDLGVLNMANTGGQILGPGMTSAVFGITGSYAPAFIVAFLVVGTGGLLVKPIRSVR